MASTNKTRNYNLNKWIGSDIPEMADFNRDNDAIDSAIHRHEVNTVSHITSAERERWSNTMDFAIYYGSGSSTQAVSLDIGFVPRVCIVFPNEYLPGVTDFSNDAHYNYFGIVTEAGGMTGLTLNNKTLTVSQNSVAVSGSEYRSFNQKGLSYVVIALR